MFLLLAILCFPHGPDCYRFPQAQFPTLRACTDEIKTYRVLENVKLHCEEKKP